MPDQLPRLAAFRAAHPGVMIGADGHFPGHADWYQARIPLRDGEHVITGHTLRELLDKLDEAFGAAPDADDSG